MTCPPNYIFAKDLTGASQCFPEICIEKTKNTVCSNIGLCFTSIKGTTRCHCYANLDPATQCTTCLTNFTLDPITKKCIPNACLNVTCHNNGFCTEHGACTCPNNFDPATNCSKCRSDYIPVTFQNIQICQGAACITGPTVCNSVGKCIDNACICAPNYDNATKCISCKAEFTKIGEACISDNCIVNESICDGKGTCDSKNVCSCRDNYDPAQKCAVCKNKFSEALVGEISQCHPQECVSDGMLCGNHGKCEKPFLSNNRCNCDYGFDISVLCKNCKPGMTLLNGECVYESCISEGQICSGTGKCTATGCTCENNFDGAKFCKNCIDNYAEIVVEDTTVCQGKECITGESICGGFGDCVDNACQCKGGRDPTQKCEKCPTDFTLIADQCVSNTCVENNIICNGKGDCKDSTCVCKNNYDTATKCKNCQKDFQEVEIDSVKQCLADACVNAGVVCGGKGSCVKDICQCIEGRDPALKCEKCPTSTTLITDQCVSNTCLEGTTICNNQGDCTNSSCVCKNNYDTATKCKNCQKDFQEVEIDSVKQCLADACVNAGVVCGGKGSCVKDICQCIEGRDPALKCEKCPTSTTLITDQCVSNTCLEGTTICNNQGDCTNSSCVCKNNFNTVTKCKSCLENFTEIDKKCVPDTCIDNDVICSGNGQCVNSACTCTGNFNSADKCKSCIANATLTDKICNCDDNFTLENGICTAVTPTPPTPSTGEKQENSPENTPTAEKATACTTSADCNNRGECVNSKCQCKGWYNAKDNCKTCKSGIVSKDPSRCIPTQCLTGGKTDNTDPKIECNGFGTCINNPILAIAGIESPQCSCKSANMNNSCELCKANFAFVTEVSDGELAVSCMPVACSMQGKTYCGNDENCVFFPNTRKFICQCKPGFDPKTGCSECKNNYDINTNCQDCVAGFNQISVCATCRYGYLQNSITGICDKCVSGFDIKKDCQGCLGELDVKQRCQGCKAGFTKKGVECVVDFNDKSVRAYVGIGLFLVILGVIVGGVLIVKFLRKKSERRFLADEAAHQELNESITANDFAEM